MVRGAWLDDDDPVGRISRRHDGARAHWRDPTLEDDNWTPPSLRGGVPVDPARPVERDLDAKGDDPRRKRTSSSHRQAADETQVATGWIQPFTFVGALVA